MKVTRKRLVEDVIHGLFLIMGLIAVGCVLMISVYLIIAGLPAIRKIGLFNFLFGEKWASTAAEPKFGILPFILTSVYGTAGAIVLGVPVGFMTAVYLAKMAPRRVRAVMESAVSLLSGIPSVVYGLVGMLVLVPFIRKTFHVPDGAGLLAAMVVLGVGRAIGEAMADMMVSGNAPNMPGLFESVRFLTTAVASEMSYSSGLQRQALFSIALVLFLFIMLINAALNFFLKRNREGK